MPQWIGGFMAFVAMVMIVTALWLWQFAPAAALQYGAAERSVYAMAGRCAAVALIAAAQWLIVVSVAGSIFQPRRYDRVFCALAAVVCGVACVSAVALGLAGK